jgi:hypothetical protein
MAEYAHDAAPLHSKCLPGRLLYVAPMFQSRYLFSTCPVDTANSDWWVPMFYSIPSAFFQVMLRLSAEHLLLNSLQFPVISPVFVSIFTVLQKSQSVPLKHRYPSTASYHTPQGTYLNTQYRRKLKSRIFSVVTVQNTNKIISFFFSSSKQGK